MATYSIETEQTFSVTYEVDAETPEGAWDILLYGSVNEALCTDQAPGRITGDFDTACVRLDTDTLD